MSGYGTLHAEHHTWEHAASPPTLLANVGKEVCKKLFPLVLLFWQLFNERAYLMSCDGRSVGDWKYPCEYTKAFIRGFPLLAASVVLLLGCRAILQQRFYYGVLKRGALLHFRQTKAWHDPLFFILIVSFIHGILHFVMDMLTSDNWEGKLSLKEEELEDLKTMIKKYMLPCLIFFAFLVHAYDTEANLLPLSKFFQDSRERSADRIVGLRMPYIVESEVQRVIPQLCLKTLPCETTLEHVYTEIIKKTSDLPIEKEDDAAGINWHLFKTLWPASVLLDQRVNDAEAKEFKRLFGSVHAVSVILLFMIFASFVSQAYKDYEDVRHGQLEDSLGLVVLVGHACITGWILFLSFLMTGMMFHSSVTLPEHWFPAASSSSTQAYI